MRALKVLVARSRLLILVLIVALAAGPGEASAGEIVPGRPRRATPAPAYAPAPRLRSSVIGYSLEDRPIVVFRAGDGSRTLMIVGGIHGGYEWNTSALVEIMVEHLADHRELVPADTTLYLLPTLNPDGAARSRGYEGRANSNGVDLNRNFPYLWAASWPEFGCWHYLPISGGRHPLSEPESQALVRFVLENHVEALISYHSAALGVFAGGQPTTGASVKLAELVASLTGYSYPPLDTGCEYTGQLVDWAVANGVTAVDVELSTHYNLDLEENLAVLAAFLEWRP